MLFFKPMADQECVRLIVPRFCLILNICCSHCGLRYYQRVRLDNGGEGGRKEGSETCIVVRSAIIALQFLKRKGRRTTLLCRVRWPAHRQVPYDDSFGRLMHRAHL